MAPPRKPKNDDVVEQTVEASEEPAARVFRLRDAAEGVDEQDVVRRVSVGCAPRVSLGPGETFSTTDAKHAEQLAATAELEEVTA